MCFWKFPGSLTLYHHHLQHSSVPLPLPASFSLTLYSPPNIFLHNSVYPGSITKLGGREPSIPPCSQAGGRELGDVQCATLFPGRGEAALVCTVCLLVPRLGGGSLGMCSVPPCSQAGGREPGDVQCTTLFPSLHFSVAAQKMCGEALVLMCCKRQNPLRREGLELGLGVCH